MRTCSGRRANYRLPGGSGGGGADSGAEARERDEVEAREGRFVAWGCAMHPALAVCLVFCGCCSNVVFLELLVR